MIQNDVFLNDVHLMQDNDSYVFVKSGPDVLPEEIEDNSKISCQIKIFWGDNLLSIKQLKLKESFSIGNNNCDYHISTDILGQEKINLISSDNNRFILTNENGEEKYLSIGDKENVNFSNIRFEVSIENPAKIIAGKYKINKESILLMGISLMVHLFLLGAMLLYMPALIPSEDGEMTDEQKFLLQQYLAAAAEKEIQQEETNVEQNIISGGDVGSKAKGSEGVMGNYNETKTNKGYALAGPKDNMDPHLARQNALKDAMEFGMIGLISSGAGGDPNSPTAPWGRDESLGNDAVSYNGNLWGQDLGNSFGTNGLGLSGIGEGSGGPGEGIGVGDNIGGLGKNLNYGFDSGRKMPGKYVPKNIVMRQGVTTASGRIPPEVIQRVIRQNFGRFRNCYEMGLRNNPNLAGRVSVKFVIGRDGSVSQASNGGSDLPDSGVVNCIVGAFRGLSFPQPENGIVTVGYSIQLSPN